MHFLRSGLLVKNSPIHGIIRDNRRTLLTGNGTATAEWPCGVAFLPGRVCSGTTPASAPASKARDAPGVRAAAKETARTVRGTPATNKTVDLHNPSHYCPPAMIREQQICERPFITLPSKCPRLLIGPAPFVGDVDRVRDGRLTRAFSSAGERAAGYSPPLTWMT
jgi:hypothetical protein